MEDQSSGVARDRANDMSRFLMGSRAGQSQASSRMRRGPDTGWCPAGDFMAGAYSMDLHDFSRIPCGGVVLGSDGISATIDTELNHTAVFGATGSQKTRRFVLPTMVACARAGESMVVTDLKGELKALTKPMLEDLGYKVFEFDLKDPQHSHGWNMLALPYRLYHSGDIRSQSRAQAMIQDISASIVPVQGEDRYWSDAGRDLLSGAMYLLMDDAPDIGYVNMLSIQTLLDRIADGDMQLQDRVSAMSPGENAKSCLMGTMQNADKTQSCILSVARTAARPFSTQDDIRSLLSSNEIDPEELVNGKAVVFITLPDDRETYNILATVFVKQIYSFLVDYADSQKHRRLSKRVDFILDEFGSYPAIPGMSTMITSARSRNIRFMLVLQGLGQIRAVYGKDDAETIIGNCNDLVFITSREMELLRYVSDLMGQDAGGRPLMTVSELQRLDKHTGEAVVFHCRDRPFIIRTVDISAYGLPEHGCPVPEHEVHKPPICDFVQTDDGMFRRFDDEV